MANNFTDISLQYTVKTWMWILSSISKMTYFQANIKTSFSYHITQSHIILTARSLFARAISSIFSHSCESKRWRNKGSAKISKIRTMRLLTRNFNVRRIFTVLHLPLFNTESCNFSSCLLLKHFNLATTWQRVIHQKQVLHKTCNISSSHMMASNSRQMYKSQTVKIYYKYIKSIQFPTWNACNKLANSLAK